MTAFPLLQETVLVPSTSFKKLKAPAHFNLVIQRLKSFGVFLLLV
jgi:hypothetical protein